ncbi:hypothetical protein GCM10029978_046890 [Actinoallomurus acanthiterrae]
MRLLKFRALVTIDPADERAWELDSPTHPLVVRAHRHHPERSRCFNAVISTDDQEPLRPGDTHHVVTMTLSDEKATEFLTPGEHFELLARNEVGRGVVSRRVFV